MSPPFGGWNIRWCIKAAVCNFSPPGGKSEPRVPTPTPVTHLEPSVAKQRLARG